jgi:predicted nucleic acid-binding protein
MYPDWDDIIDYQVSCLKSGSTGIGIPDLLIAQNCIQNNVPVYSIDKHFKFQLIQKPYSQ